MMAREPGRSRKGGAMLARYGSWLVISVIVVVVLAVLYVIYWFVFKFGKEDDDG
jgi:hypothetical protein